MASRRISRVHEDIRRLQPLTRDEIHQRAVVEDDVDLAVSAGTPRSGEAQRRLADVASCGTIRDASASLQRSKPSGFS